MGLLSKINIVTKAKIPMTTYVCCVHLAVRNRTKAVPVLDSFVQFIYFHGNLLHISYFFVHISHTFCH